MGSRIDLHNELGRFNLKLYFQPPSNIQLTYPCIIYSKTDTYRQYGNDSVYLRKQGYKLMVIDKNPDSVIAESIEEHFQYCKVEQHYTVDNLNHTTLQLYY